MVRLPRFRPLDSADDRAQDAHQIMNRLEFEGCGLGRENLLRGRETMLKRLVAPCCAILGLIALVFILTLPAMAQKALLRDDLKNEAVRLEEQLRKQVPNPGARQPAQWRQDAANALRAGNANAAVAHAAGAIIADPRDHANWLIYARAALQLAETTTESGIRYTHRDRATTAAYAAYERATTKPEEAESLAQLARVFEVRQSWRSALDAYRLSLIAQDNKTLREKYEALRAERGFQAKDYKVDSDAASPRVCVEFSDPLERGKVDFTPFVVIQGVQNPAVTGENTQLCVDGLKHGERYKLVIRQGLPSSVHETLLKAVDYDIYVRDRSPQVRFTGRNYVLPRVGQEGIPLVTVNAEKAEIDVYRIGDRSIVPTVRSDDFMKQLSSYSARNIQNEKGIKVWSGQLATRVETNQDVVTAFPVAEALGKIEPGVYAMTARLRRPARDSTPDEEDYGGGDLVTQWFVVSDLGLSAFSAHDGIHVMVRGLADAQPMRDADVRLLARNNEVLASVKTDARGLARFAAGLSRGKDGLAPALVVVTDGKGDYGFLDVAASAFDLTDRGVKGRDAPAGLDAFLTSERGVYRPGETVYVTALLRDAAGKVVENLPLTLVYKRPDGVEHRRILLQDQGVGGRAHSLSLFSGAARGTWRVQAYSDPKGEPIGEMKFLVEDYVADRIDVTAMPKADFAAQGSPIAIDVTARYLYGAPGANLQVTGDITLQAATSSPIRALEGYQIGLSDEKLEPSVQELEESATTDADGKAALSIALPEKEAQRPLEARIRVRVGEAGGRAVERVVTVPVRPDAPVVAVKKLFEDTALTAGALANFEIVAANPDGSRLARQGVNWTLSRLERRYQWYFTDGRWAYEGSRNSRRISDGMIDLSAQEAKRLSLPVEWGTYRLDVTMGAAQTSVVFSVGYWGEPTADAPDLLEVALDKEAYATGETMKLALKPRFAGKATVAVIGDKVHEWHVLDVTPGGASLDLTAKAEWGAGAYVVALAHRPLDQAAKRMPGRSLGLAWFSLDKAARALQVKLEAPEKIRPRGTLDIPVTLAGLKAGEEAFVTVSAVDIGILNLTRHEVPKPGEHFFGQRKLSAELRDLYGFLIDGMQGTRGAVRSGGDAGVDSSVSPPREAPLARFSGVVKVGADGKARVSFDIPAFDGSVRVVAMAWTKDRVGQAAQDVVIRDQLVAQATLPRFLTLGDRSRFHVRIDNVEGPAGDYTVEIVPQGPIVMPAEALSRRISLAQKASRDITIPVTAGGVGDGAVTVRLSGPGGSGVERSLPIRITPGSDALLRRVVRRVAPGESLTVSADLTADLLPGSGTVSTSVALYGGIDVPALLAALDRYPYGCTEQTVSRAMPLLYANALASRERLALDDKTDERIREAIDRILARQDSNGSFGLWSVGGSDLWLDAFVLDFLTRARERQFAVPQKAFEIGLDRLRNEIINKAEFDRTQADTLAYALYVLARNGRPMMSDLRYLADTKLAEVPTPIARAQIAASLALLGDRPRAERSFRSAIESLRALRDDPRDSRSDYGSRLRDAAAVMTLAAEANLGPADIIQSASIVSETRAIARYTSTQEQAWMVLAAQAVAKDVQAMQIDVDGQPHKGALHRIDRASALEAKPLRIANTGNVPVDAVLTVSGNPAEPQPAASNGYQVERAYYKLDGTKVETGSLRQNDRFVVVVTVTEREARKGNLLLVDHLPAGLEIDNPNLIDGGKVEALKWLKRSIEPSHTEYRDDRFVAAFERWDSRQAVFSVAYMVRAVSPGRYVHPPAVIEDMYRPEKFGRTAYGMVEVAGQ
jgi:alpha-2-macroglobulin